MIKGIFRLVRPINLLLIALTQYLIKYALLIPLKVDVSLDLLHFSLLVLSTLCIASAGNIINDIFDVHTDGINKPNKVIIGKIISEKLAYNLYMGFTLIGVGIGFYISNQIGKQGLSAIFVIISALLYVYASYLKQTLLVGNVVISALVGFSILIIGLFELYPATTEINQFTQTLAMKKIMDYAVFAFMINLLREIVKDIEDIEGDKEVGMKTLPIVLGKAKGMKAIFILAFIPLFAITYYIVTYWYNQQIAVIYFLLFIIGPMIFLVVKSLSAKTKQDFKILSNLLKFIMLTGVLSLLIYPLILK